MAINIYETSPLDGFEVEEARLYRQINQYRAENGVPPIPPSQSLSLVANRHVLDLKENIGELTHSWSDADYDNNDSSTWVTMWEAPQRLGTEYDDNGFENAFFSSAGATAAAALEGWQNSDGHNDVLLNLDVWSDSEWQALGIGIYEEYAVMWVGESIDPANAPTGVRQGWRTGTSARNTIRGTRQADILTGQDGRDRLLGRQGNDVLGGGNGNDQLRGQGGDDILFGQAGRDSLGGGGGDDILYGGAGRDRLTGNRGNDIFVLEKGNGLDTVTDFNRGSNQLGITDGINAADVSFVEDGNDTLVRIDGTNAMRLLNVTGINRSVITRL
ncbi:MAG: hypothetical protein F6K09_12670 [Merismopedia sp. SIO2A8]|nr:hypothetical protein [Merismopedia sp. SIO2A8]